MCNLLFRLFVLAALCSTAAAGLPTDAQAVQACFNSPARIAEVQAGFATGLPALAGDAFVPEAYRKVFARLERAAHLGKGVAVRLVARRSPHFNASMSPNGELTLNSGLWEDDTFALAPDEAAAVMAHELAHLEERHTHRMMCETAVAINATDMPLETARSIGRLEMGRGNSQLAFRLRSLRRQQELQADARGLEILTAAGFPADAMGRMLVKIGASSARARNRTPGASHPDMDERLAALGQMEVALRFFAVPR